jgi:uncharacterized protein (TIGR02569 family)
LAGGRGIAWKVGDRILKPVDVTPIELEWQATTLSTQPRDGFRLSLPIRAVDGSVVVDGWAAWPVLVGQHEQRRWVDIIEVGRRFHRAVEPLDRPTFLDKRTDPWATGDRVAWGDTPDTPYRHVPYVAELVDRLRPPPTSDQLIHGDLTGNVLFAHDEPPAIIDLSLYWRPVGYATAIVVADAIGGRARVTSSFSTRSSAKRHSANCSLEPSYSASSRPRAQLNRAPGCTAISPRRGDRTRADRRLTLNPK